MGWPKASPKQENPTAGISVYLHKRRDFKEQQEGEKEVLKEKHYRMAEDVLQIIQNRDKERYPSESNFINEVIRAYPEQKEKEKIQEELGKIFQKLDELCGFLYLKNYGSDAGEKEIF